MALKPIYGSRPEYDQASAESGPLAQFRSQAKYTGTWAFPLECGPFPFHQAHWAYSWAF